MGIGLVVYYKYSRNHVKPYAERLEKLLRGHGNIVTEVEQREGEGGESPPPSHIAPRGGASALLARGVEGGGDGGESSNNWDAETIQLDSDKK